jgi:hypothetical protein
MFRSAGGILANGVAIWDGAQWSALGTGLDYQRPVGSTFEFANHDIIAGFSGAYSGGPPVLQRWNGQTWQAVPISESAEVNAMVPDGSGGLFAAGFFSNVAATPARSIARLYGAVWSSIGDGLVGAIYTLRPLPDGSLFAGGAFGATAAAASPNVAKRLGAVWRGMGSGVPQTTWASTIDSNGELIVGCTAWLGVNAVLRWHNNTWQSLGTSFNGSVWALATLPSGDIVAGGQFTTVDGTWMAHVARWDGSGWRQMSGTNDWVQALAVTPAGLVAAGNFTAAGSAAVANHIAMWNGSDWTPMGSGLTSGNVYALAVLPTGDVVAGGDFLGSGTTTANGVARWDGSQWHAMGSGLTAPQYWYVEALTVATNGDVIAGGHFSNSGVNHPATNLARWNGTTWNSMGAERISTNYEVSDVFSLATLPNGDIAVGTNAILTLGQVSSGLARFGCQPCYPNCDSSSVPPLLNAADFQCFLNQFSASLSASHDQQVACYANCDGSTIDPVLNIADFLCFINKFAAGCP